MMQLEQLQNDLIAAIFNNDIDAAKQHVKGDEKLSAKQRVGIYRGSVHGILTTSLGITFTVCKQLVGEQFFDKMCDVFIDEYPPQSPFFAKYGNDLNQFLADFEPVKSLPYLSDMAKLEWARNEISQKPLPEPFDFSALASLNDDQQSKLLFKLKNTMRLVQSDYRIDLLWCAHQEDSLIVLEDININQAVKLIIWKSDAGIQLKEFTDSKTPFWDFLYAISKQKNLTELAEQFKEDLPVLLNQAIQEGWIESYITTTR